MLAGDPCLFTIARASTRPSRIFRNKKLFDLGFEEPNKIEIHDGSKSYFLTRSGSDWWDPDGKNLDGSTVTTSVEKVRAVAATKFPESGFTKPVLDLVVISNDSRRSERVSFAKHGDDCIAKRESEQVLYELPSSAIQQLQESAENGRPASAPEK